MGEKRCRSRERQGRHIRQLERTLGRKSLKIEIPENVVGERAAGAHSQARELRRFAKSLVTKSPRDCQLGSSFI